MKTYTPSPLNAENITLPDNLTELTEAMARNVHEVWALGRVKEGWKYGETRNDELKTHPGLVPYEELPDVIPAFIILFLVAALIVTCTTFQNLIQFFPSRGMTYLMTLHAIISLSVCICFFLCIKRLIDVFSLNLEQERNILASLYQEKEKREIINNDEKEINKLKENIRKELKQETEKKETA